MRRALAIAAGVVLAVAPAVPAAAIPGLPRLPGPPSAPEYWFSSWHIPALWARGIRGQGVTIAEIDTGVNAKLPELRGRILSGHDFGAPGNGQVDRQRSPFGHGTAMASIMVAGSGVLGIEGIAPGAKILPIAVPLTGTTTAAEPDRVPQAIRYAADQHADIISMSLGGARTPGVERQPCSDDEQAAIYYALRKGALVIASVGNTGPTRNVIEDPGVCLGVLAVGAVDATDTVATFSSRQPYLTLDAPGVDIPSLGRIPGQAYAGSGTSQATALASAAAALVWSAHPDLGARGVAARMIATLDDHRAAPDPAYGYGVLDTYRAVTAHVPADAPDPVFAAVAPFMARVDALGARLPKPPPAARAPLRSAGRFAVRPVPSLTAQIRLGIALAAAGAAALAVLAVVGVRSRRRTAAARAGADAEPRAVVPPG